MRGRSSGEAAARLRAAVLAALILAAPVLSGCGREDPAAREARATLRAFLSDLRAHDEPRLRARAVCIVPSEGVSDARLRRVEPPRPVHPATLDSLSAAYTASRLLADSLYAATPDASPAVEERFQSAREWARRETTVRAAARAARQSARDRDAASGAGEAGTRAADGDGYLESVRAHVVVRYAGPAVGPDRIERAMVVRLLRAPGGPWIVYAFDLASDPIGPIPF